MLRISLQGDYMEAGMVSGWLAVWAVVAPVATAAGAAWWHRRNQLEDKKREVAADALRAKRAQHEIDVREFKAFHREGLRDRRDTFIAFASLAHDFVYKPIGNPPDYQVTFNGYREAFGKALSRITLLDGANIGTEAVELWNACWESRTVVPGMPDADVTRIHQRLLAARAAFGTRAQILINEHVAALNSVLMPDLQEVTEED